jgi:hypothetical protein
MNFLVIFRKCDILKLLTSGEALSKNISLSKRVSVQQRTS